MACATKLVGTLSRRATFESPLLKTCILTGPSIRQKTPLKPNRGFTTIAFVELPDLGKLVCRPWNVGPDSVWNSIVLPKNVDRSTESWQNAELMACVVNLEIRGEANPNATVHAAIRIENSAATN